MEAMGLSDLEYGVFDVTADPSNVGLGRTGRVPERARILSGLGPQLPRPPPKSGVQLGSWCGIQKKAGRGNPGSDFTS